MKLKLDLHVHTIRSPDAFTEVNRIPQLCEKARIDGLAITDHNRPALDLPNRVCVIPGVEISTRDGHVIGLGLSAQIPRGLTADETIREIQMRGGVAIIPHPYDFWRSSVSPEILTEKPNAIEVINSSSMFHSISWKRARDFAKRNGLPCVAGSDSHIPETLGTAYTTVETDSGDSMSILESIRTGSVIPNGKTIKVRHRIRKLLFQATRRRHPHSI